MPITGTVTWKGGSMVSMVRSDTNRKLGEASELLVESTKRMLNVPYPPASQPGEPPHKRTGDLQDAVRAEVDTRNHTARIGILESSQAPYAVELEIGVGVAPRPFLRPSFLQNLRKVGKILGQPVHGILKAHGGASGQVKNFTRKL